MTGGGIVPLIPKTPAYGLPPDPYRDKTVVTLLKKLILSSA